MEKELVKITVPAGIGDGLWVAQTLDTSKDYHVEIVNQGDERGHKIWELLPFVKKITYIKGAWERKCTHELNTTFFKGLNIEDIGKKINWSLPIKTTAEAKKYAAKTLTKKGKHAYKRFYIGIYASSYSTSQQLGGWSLEHWKKLLNGLKEIYPTAHFVFIGANYDDLTKDLANSTNYPVIDEIGKGIGDTIELLKKMDLMVGFQSGLGCLSTYYDKKTVMLFAKKYEAMQSTFCRKSSIEKTWKGCQFCAPEDLINWIKSKWS